MHHADSRGGKLDGQGDPVEPGHDLRDGALFGGVRVEASPRLSSTVGEQSASGLVVERRDAPSDLSLDPQRLPTRSKYSQPGREVQKSLDQPSRPVQHLFAVVEHEQYVEIAQLLRDRVDQRAAVLVAKPEHTRNCLRDSSACDVAASSTDHNPSGYRSRVSAAV